MKKLNSNSYNYTHTLSNNKYDKKTSESYYTVNTNSGNLE